MHTHNVRIIAKRTLRDACYFASQNAKNAKNAKKSFVFDRKIITEETWKQQ
jgi:hypothetical protein